MHIPNSHATRKPFLSLERKRSLSGWAFLSVAACLIIWLNFYPMVRGFIIALHTGAGANMTLSNPIYRNFARLFEDPQFRQTVSTTFLYLIVQVPIMLVLALILASMLNQPSLKGKAIFRTAIFLPCAVGLVAYALIFRQMFAHDGLINSVLISIGVFETGHNWLNSVWSARLVIIIGLLWRWTGFATVLYLAGLQNIDRSIYEAAKIDGAGIFQQFRKITIPLLSPIILLTAIMSTNGTLQLFDESMNLTGGRPGMSTMTMSHYIYQTAFVHSPNLSYASAMSFAIFIFVAVLALIQIKVGDKR